jgi:capsular polysaccharide biosynthesis protein
MAAFLRDLETSLRRAPAPSVAVLTGDNASTLPALLTAAFPAATVSTHRTALGESRLHVQLAAAGPFDVLVDDVGPHRDRGQLFRSVFLHLRPGGSMLIRNARARRLEDPEHEDGLAATIAELVAGRLSEPPPPKGRRRGQDEALAAAANRLTVRANHVVVSNRVAAKATLRDEQTDELLRLRPGSGRVVETRAPLVFGSRARVRESSSPQAGRMPAEYRVPAVSLREYFDVVCAPGQVVWSDNVLLPDTFRRNQRPSLGNLFVDPMGPLFGDPGGAGTAEEALPGAYFYLDSEYRGHFGHAMTEQLSRLWAWRRAKQEEPELKALLILNKDRELARFEQDLYAAAGVPAEDLCFVRGRVRVERLLAATPMFSQPDYVHPALAELWGEVSDRLAARAPEREYARKIFCARRIVKRQCRNAEQVEDLFAGHGFEVIFSEDYDLAEQARIFREADVVGGFAGSALFNLLFSRAPKHVVMISSESYTAQNEYMISSVLGHRLDVAWCRPEIPRTPGRFSMREFQSPFSFDLDREGAWVRQVLGS